jgi:hypothetical protein
MRSAVYYFNEVDAFSEKKCRNKNSRGIHTRGCS